MASDSNDFLDKYNSDWITYWISYREAIRMRPGMYVGDAGISGLHHLFKEIISNSIDEVLARHCDQITVILGKDRSITVTDNGRGIPLDIDLQTSKTALELIMTKMHAGGKFGSSGYKTSGGRHGVGASCVNALSTWMETTVRRDGAVYRMRCEHGIVTQPPEVIGACDPDEHGTTQQWLADDGIFKTALTDSGELDYQTERFIARIREYAFLNREVTITFQDALHDAEPIVFHSSRGVADYVAYLNNGKEALHNAAIYFLWQEEATQVEIAMQFCRCDEEVVYVFANNIFLSRGGTPLVGFKVALTRTINRYARKNGFLRQGKANFPGDAVRTGWTAVLSLRLINPLFNSADRSILRNIEVEGIVSRTVGKGLSRFLEENPAAARAILENIAAQQN